MMGWNALMLASLAFAAGDAAAQPVVRLFELQTDPLQQDAFDAAGRQNMAASLASEPGVLAIHTAADSRQPGMVYVFEIYADTQAYQAHLATSHYADFLRQTQRLISKKTVVDTTPVFLAEKPEPLSVMTRGKTPEVRIVEVTVKRSDLAAFRQIVTAEMRESMAVEAGVLAMYAVTRTDHPEKWIFFEIYADADAYAAHRKTPHFSAYLQQTGAMLVEKGHKDVSAIALKNRGGLMYDVPGD